MTEVAAAMESCSTGYPGCVIAPVVCQTFQGPLRGRPINISIYPGALSGWRSCNADPSTFRDRIFTDSLLEQSGFEPVWGFSSQVVIFGL